MLLPLLLSVPFDPAATTLALSHPEGRPGALQQVLALGKVDLDRARAAGLGAKLSGLVGDAEVAFVDRVVATRALTLFGADAARDALTARLMPGADASPEDTALAREAALALRRLGARAELAVGATSTDPEVRATAAEGAALDPAARCALATKDRWPDVRVGAARALVADEAAAKLCVAQVLVDPEPRVVAGALSAAQVHFVSGTIEPLRALAAKTDGPLPLRAEALVALGLQGDLDPARKVLNTHLAKGGIVPLAEGAVRALAGSGSPEDRPRLVAALESEAELVRLAAGRALAAMNATDVVPRLRALRAKADPRHQEAWTGILETLGVPPDAEPDPADLDTEDESP